MELRPYQTECINAIIKSAKNTRNSLVALPTGSGKTVIFSKLIEHILSKKKAKILILVNKNILIQQTVDKLSYCIDAGLISVYCAGYGKKQLDGSVVIASTQSLCNYAGLKLNFNLIILDEVHRMIHIDKLERLTSILNRINYNKIVGFTATPFSN